MEEVREQSARISRFVRDIVVRCAIDRWMRSDMDSLAFRSDLGAYREPLPCGWCGDGLAMKLLWLLCCTINKEL